MGGIILYAYFLFAGFLYANEFFKEKDIYFRVWSGLIFGNLIIMAGVVPFAFIFGFTVLTHVITAVAAIAPYAVIQFRRKEKINLKALVVIKNDKPERFMDRKIFCFLIAPVTLLICILMSSHILAPMDNGAVGTGQCTYGDLAMHLNIVTALSQQHTFPPEYTIIHGERLSYPFFIDMLSGSLHLFGTPLRWAVLIPSFTFAFMIVMGFYILSYSLTGKKTAAVAATLLFFLNGGFGFAYFLEGAKADHTAFTKIFTDYYHTPTNYNEHNIRWANTICDMIIPQRTTMAGWTMMCFIFWCLQDAVKTGALKRYIMLGVAAGLMPMVHTHSFMALGIISIVMMAIYLATEKDKKTVLKNWLYYGVIAAVLALPQLFIWTFGQAGNEGFTKIAAGWVNENDPDIWFWVKNWGMIIILIIPAFLNTSRYNKNLLWGCLAVFATAYFVQTQPLAYDNNKLFFISYMICVIVTAEFLVVLYEKLRDIKLRGRAFIAALTAFVMLFSGVLTIGREWKSGNSYQHFSKSDLEFAEFIKDNTETDAVFMTYTEHLNPVTVLAGRSVYVGASLFLNFHGFADKFREREAQMKEFYTSMSAGEIKSFADENDITYVVISSNETGNMNVNTSAFSGFEKIYDKNSNKIYKVR